MTKEELLNRAIKIADKAHKGQTDKYHAPYIGHVMRVMNYGKTLDEKIDLNRVQRLQNDIFQK